MVEKDGLHGCKFGELLGLIILGYMWLLRGFVGEILYQWLDVHSFFLQPLAAAHRLFSILALGGESILDDV